MSITTPKQIPDRDSERAATQQAGGLRILGTRTLHLFAGIRYEQFAKAHITLGRARQRDIRVRDPAVSRHHCTIIRNQDGSHALADRGSRNGVWLREPVPDGAFRRVYHTPLIIGMHLRLGPVTVVVTDAAGQCPILAVRGSEFCRLAVAVYGSRRAAAQVTGIKRTLLGRLVPAAPEGSR